MLSGRILPLISAILLVSVGCTTNLAQQPVPTQEMTIMAAPYQTDITQLSQFIHLPAQPTQALWQVREKGIRGDAIGPTDMELVAVLQFDHETLSELQSQFARQTNPSDLFVARSFVQPWFPDPMQQMFVTDPAYPEFLKLAGTRYQPTVFAKGSLNNGYIVVASDFVFIYLYTM